MNINLRQLLRQLVTAKLQPNVPALPPTLPVTLPIHSIRLFLWKEENREEWKNFLYRITYKDFANLDAWPELLIFLKKQMNHDQFNKLLKYVLEEFDRKIVWEYVRWLHWGWDFRLMRFLAYTANETRSDLLEFILREFGDKQWVDTLRYLEKNTSTERWNKASMYLKKAIGDDKWNEIEKVLGGHEEFVDDIKKKLTDKQWILFLEEILTQNEWDDAEWSKNLEDIKEKTNTEQWITVLLRLRKKLKIEEWGKILWHLKKELHGKVWDDILTRIKSKPNIKFHKFDSDEK